MICTQQSFVHNTENNLNGKTAKLKLQNDLGLTYPYLKGVHQGKQIFLTSNFICVTKTKVHKVHFTSGNFQL